MSLVDNRIGQLTAFRQRDKFSDSVWNERGLNPSDLEISSKMTELFNHCANDLIDAIERKSSRKKLKGILKAHLLNFRKSDLDTEEKELVSDLFYELAQILGIDFNDILNSWLYGWLMIVIMKVHAIVNPEKILDRIRQTCSTCDGAIDTFIKRGGKNIPDYSWYIVRCNNCKDYSIVSYGPGVKEVKFGNYELVQELSKEEFTKEQAEIRLEQLRSFRK